jgi:calcineurin-like phosphoesterase family protein
MEKKIFVTSDQHFDHANIIKYCKRPFSSVDEMNKALLANWNNAIGKRDLVFFLGDLAYKGRNINYWLEQLNGNIIFIKGNHDKSDRIEFFDGYMLNYRGIRLYLCHDAEQAPKNWSSWIITGHYHNNDLEKYPFINKERKIANVSVELTDYKPVNLDDLTAKMSS